MIEVLQDKRGALVLAPSGEICPVTAPALACCIDGCLDSGQRHLVIDLADVTLLTAAGIGVIAAGASRATEAGGTLELRNASGLVERVLTISGLDRYLDAGHPAAMARWN